jgi:excisionase family DNA binding protein
MSRIPTALVAPIVNGIPLQELSVSQAALTKNVGERTLRRWIATGMLPALRLPNGQIRIRLADLDGLGEPVHA